MRFVVLACVACSPDDVILPAPPVPRPESEDVAFEAGAQDLFDGELQRGRGCTAADLDLDGDPDLVLTNPTDVTRVLLNESTPGTLRFVPGPVLHTSSLVWGAAAADLDGDRDLDLFLATGGLEGLEYEQLLVNELVERGALSFVDEAEAAGVLGPWRTGEPSVQIRTASVDAQFVDVDADADLDVWVDTTHYPTFWSPPPPSGDLGRNQLWRNNGDGTFTDVAIDVGLDGRASHRFSSWLDIDQDLDLDVYVNVMGGGAALYRNDGGVFTDVTAEWSLDGGDLSAPDTTFASAASDLNNDGWDDLFLFSRGWPTVGPYRLGHTVLINAKGRGFVDATAAANVNDPFEPGFRDHEGNGVMGATVRDLNGDGIPDLFMGNGGPSAGEVDNLYLSVELREVDLGGEAGVQLVPLYENRTDLVDMAGREDPTQTGDWPTYPYRTHAACVSDFDADGQVELFVMNGGMSLVGGDSAREPKQLFRFAFDPAPAWLNVELRGDGVHVPYTPIGSRITVTAAKGDETWVVRDRLRSIEGFAAQHDPVRWFGLGDADHVVEITVEWTDGTVTTLDDVELGTKVEISR